MKQVISFILDEDRHKREEVARRARHGKRLSRAFQAKGSPRVEGKAREAAFNGEIDRSRTQSGRSRRPTASGADAPYLPFAIPVGIGSNGW
jgi:hypothetical protein